MQETDHHYKVLVCGATASAIGFAEKFGSDVLIVERTSLIAGEFIDSNKQNETSWTAKSVLGEELRDQLAKNNVLNNTPFAAIVLFKRIKEKGLNILFQTEIINIEKKQQIFEVTIYNNSGLQKVTADKIIDTTSLGVSNISNVKSKSINPLLACPNKTLFPFDIKENEVEFYKGRYESEIIMKFKVDVNDDIMAARHKLHTYWSKRKIELSDWLIACIPSTFDVTVDVKEPLEIMPGWIWMPSCASDNLIDAFEIGVEMAEKNEVQL